MNHSRKLMRLGSTLVLACVATGCGAEGTPDDVVAEQEQELHNRAFRASALRDVNGARVGTVTFFRAPRGGTVVSASVDFDSAQAGFHGFHIHANDNPANGEGCVPPFTAVDGHYNPDGSDHGDHAGDMPVLLVNADGTGAASFVTDRFTVSELTGRAVIVHSLPDNYANIPIGDAPDQYTPNSPDAVAATLATGNAGSRIACGLIE